MFQQTSTILVLNLLFDQLLESAISHNNRLYPFVYNKRMNRIYYFQQNLNPNLRIEPTQHSFLDKQINHHYFTAHRFESCPPSLAIYCLFIGHNNKFPSM